MAESQKVIDARAKKIKFITQLVKMGCSDHTIGLKLKRSTNAIGDFRRKYGIPASRDQN